MEFAIGRRDKHRNNDEKPLLMYNPRFPHSFRLKKARYDEYGNPVFDDNGDAIYEYVNMECVEMKDHEPVRDSEGNFVTYFSEEVNFGYRTSSKSASTVNDMVTADFCIACPMVLTEIHSGETLELRDYERTYYGTVVKKTTFNLGTNIWFNEVRN